MLSLGITHIVSCSPAVGCSFPADFQYCDLRRQHMAMDNGLRIMFADAHRSIAAAERAGGVCLVHCTTGITVAPAIALAYLMRTQRKSLLESLAALRCENPAASPEPKFMWYLYDLELELFHCCSLKMDVYYNDRFSPTEELCAR